MYSLPKDHQLEYRADIDGLRAWAVLTVLLYHLEVVGFEGGFIGVDVFFVISGYLITRNIRTELERRRFSLKQFYARRARRLMPALLVTLSLSLWGAWFVSASTHLMGAAKSAMGASLSISNLLFWKQTSYFDDALKLNPFLHTWSLSLEEQFYLFYPLILIGFMLLSDDRKRFKIQLGLLTITSFLVSLWLTKHQTALAFYMAPARLWEFTLGGLIWLLEPQFFKLEQRKDYNLLAVLGGSLIILGCYIINEDFPFPGALALLPCCGAALVILARPRARGLGWIFSNQALVKIGQMSYSIYLVHWPLIALYRNFKFELTLTVYDQLGLALITFLGAYLLHFGVESPLRRQKRLWGKISLIHVLIVVTLMICGGASYLQSQQRNQGRVVMASLGLPADTPLDQFKRNTYGGKDCAPPRCSASGSDLDPLQSEVSSWVIGDSYALALYSGIVEHLEASNVVFWERSACEFYSIRYEGFMNKYLSKCLETKRETYAALAAHPELPVLLSQHWWGNFNEEMHYLPTYQVENSDHITHSLPQTRRFETLEEYADFVAKELIELKHTLKLRQLTIVGGPPKFAAVFSPLDCLLSPTQSRDCTLSKLNDFTSWHQRFQLALSKRSQGEFSVIDLYPALCHADQCRNITPQGELIYSDYGHLSIWGASRVVGANKEEFARALGVSIRPIRPTH